MSEPTSLLLGLEGLQVTSVSVRPDRTRVVDVVSADSGGAVCPQCAVRSVAVKDRAMTSPRDLRYGDDPITLRWSKTRYRCRNDECDRVTFTEQLEQVPARRGTTMRLRTQIGRDIGENARSATEVAAAAAGVSWPTAHAALVEHADQVLQEPRPVTVIESMRLAGASPGGFATPQSILLIQLMAGRGSIRGTPDSSTSLATRACWGRSKDAPPPR